MCAPWEPRANGRTEGDRTDVDCALEPLEDRRMLSLAGLVDHDMNPLAGSQADGSLVALAADADPNAAPETGSSRVEVSPFAAGEILIGFEGHVPAVHRAEGAAAALAAAGKLLGPNGPRSPRILAEVPAAPGRAARLATHWQLPAGADVLEMVRQLTNRPGIAYAEPNYLLSIDATPNDPQLGELWGLHNTGQTGGTPGADIDAIQAWDIATGSSDIVVGVIDTGADYTHPDLAANIWVNPGEIAGNGIDDDGNGYIDDVYGWDFYNNDSDPFDDNGHGTHCSGTIGAVGDNAIGVVGVNWNVQIMGLKFLGAGGGGSTDGAVAAVNYATRCASSTASRAARQVPTSCSPATAGVAARIRRPCGMRSPPAATPACCLSPRRATPIPAP